MDARQGLTLITLLLSACGDAAPEPPPPDPTPVEGVFGTAPAAARGVPSIVTLTAPAPIDLTFEAPVIDQFGLQFNPDRVIARTGVGVVFQNSESLTHNVNVRSLAADSTLVNDDMPPSGSLTVVFEEEGGYDVLCDAHPGMTAFIFVTSAPYATYADAEGAFHLSGVPAGEYSLDVWSVDPEARSSRTITVRDGAATEVAATPLG